VVELSGLVALTVRMWSMGVGERSSMCGREGLRAPARYTSSDVAQLTSGGSSVAR
jgi:hypothetical protein